MIKVAPVIDRYGDFATFLAQESEGWELTYLVNSHRNFLMDDFYRANRLS